MNERAHSNTKQPKALATRHGALALPAFLPDATRGVVRTIDAADVAGCGITAMMVNLLHLSSHPGTSAVAALGGVHRFMGWRGPVASDSGGFQAFSLTAGGRKLGSVSDQGFTYRFDAKQKKRALTPETCIRKQLQLGSDILFCLDYCTHPRAAPAVQRESVERTVAWARRCKAAFEEQLAKREDASRPLLFAVVQGGEDAALRRECAERLLEIGFDGYGFGGWPIDDAGGLVEMVAHVAELVPDASPKHALGIGKPENLARAFALGYGLFDCALPTRDARHGRLFAFKPGLERVATDGTVFYDQLRLEDDKYTRDKRPIEAACDCACCRSYSRAYVHHLFQVNDPLAMRLATMHNLRFYARLIDRLRAPQDGPDE